MAQHADLPLLPPPHSLPFPCPYRLSPDSPVKGNPLGGLSYTTFVTTSQPNKVAQTFGGAPAVGDHQPPASASIKVSSSSLGVWETVILPHDSFLTMASTSEEPLGTTTLDESILTTEGTITTAGVTSTTTVAVSTLIPTTSSILTSNQISSLTQEPAMTFTTIPTFSASLPHPPSQRTIYSTTSPALSSLAPPDSTSPELLSSAQSDATSPPSSSSTLTNTTQNQSVSLQSGPIAVYVILGVFVGFGIICAVVTNRKIVNWVQNLIARRRERRIARSKIQQ